MRPGRPQPEPRGFSLFELVIVLAIMSTVVAIALPRYAGAVDRYRVELAAQRIVADLASARLRAQGASRSRTVQFDVALERYELIGEPHPDDPDDPYVVDLRDPPYEADLVSAAFDGSPSVSFDMFGRPSSGGLVQVRAGAVKKTVALDEDTGAADVQ